MSDGTLSTFKNFSIRLYQANTAPRFEDSAGNVLEELTVELEEDFSTSVWQQKLSGLVLSDDDPSNLWFSLSMESSPSKGIVFLDPNSTNNLFIDYQPALNFHGTDQFSVRLTDSNVPPKSSILSLNLNILPVNDPPVISSSPITQITEGEEYRYELSVYDPDLNDTHVFYEIQLPDWLTLDVGEGVISGTPEWYDYSPNPYFISIGVKDKSGAFGVQEYGVSVTPLNFPPEIELGEKITVVIDEDEFPRAWNDLELVVSDPTLISVFWLGWFKIRRVTEV